MAQPKTLSFGNFIIRVKPPAGVLTAPCAFTQKGLEFTANVNTQQIPDCDDPDAPYWEAATVASLAMRLSASGILAMEHLDTWRAIYFGAKSVEAEVELKATAANGGGKYSGLLVLTSFSHTASLGNKAEIAVAGQGDGAWIWTDAAA